jgi:hypothetical protein
MTSAALQLRPREFHAHVRAYLDVASSSVASVANLSTTVDSVGAGENRIPVSINCSEANNAWVCSPHTAYSRYSIEELQRFGHAWLTKPLSWLCKGLGGYLWRAQLDDAVGINNWLVSTNLYPELEPSVLSVWIDEARARWPGHAIWFRSLNPRYNSEWLQALQAAGFTMIPSRQVYLYDRVDGEAVRPKNLRRDLDLLLDTSLTASGAASWSPEDFARAEELYGLLYLKKYSQLNPAYSAQFLRGWHQAGLLELTGYRDEQGTLQGVVGVFVIGRTITAPIVGYDTAQPQRTGLYRLLMATVYDLAARSGYRINLSAGAAGFKRLRGGVGTMEYSAVCARHLPRNRQRAISMLAKLATGIGEPMMKRFEL